MLIDTHAHLDFPDFREDLDQVVQRAVDNGVTHIVSIGTQLESSLSTLKLGEQFKNIHPAVGIHPCHVHEVADADWFLKMREMAKHPSVVAIGECGLDYHHLPSKQIDANTDGATVERLKIEDERIKKLQVEFFHAQLELAVELNLNMVIHQRDSWDDVLKMLEPYHGKLRVVFHCFGGTPEQAKFLIDHNHLVSFTGIVTFKNAKQVQETVVSVPVNQFMVETDCPYLAPAPDRGKRCEPMHTLYTAQKIAELRNVLFEEIAEATTLTAKQFFRFSSELI